MNAGGLVGWENLRHGGLLLDAQRQGEVAAREAEPLSFYIERDLRRMASGGVLEGNGDVPAFVTFILTKVCGFTDETGTWWRGNKISADWGRKAITGEKVKPRQLWRGHGGGILPVFIEKDKRIGVGRGRRSTSRVLQWLRAGDEKLALITNGRQWRLIFAGLDFDAWCEWDLDLWLEEGQLSPQVSVLRTIFLPEQWIPSAPDEPFTLLQAILDSRKGQAELSAVLGERVREAVELLLQAHGDVLKETCADIDPAEIYRAAVRVVMRMAVILFAESRELLPRDNAMYHGSYGLTGLLEELEKVAARGGNRLARSYNAWPRMLALFRLVYLGSHHPELLVPAYGGELFAAGDPESVDPMERVIAVFESACYERELFPDRMVYRILERITRTKVKVRQGRSSTWITAPVDFSDLSSEYIGILYEGLLDFELKMATEGDPVIFLAVGNQPALPLSRLEAMDDRALTNLFDKLKDTSSSEASVEEAEELEEELEAGEVEGEDETEEDAEELEEPEEEEDAEDARHVTRTRAETWARHAVEVAKLVSKPRGSMTPEKRLAYEEAIARKARQLVSRVVLSGEWYLVRWGGTRKGAGTFYTRPGLAVPTVQRTLRPLVYDPPLGKEGDPNRDAPPLKWTPKKPEEILALKVCDPACGSGSFPVAALRFLTEALYQSLHHHGRISEQGQSSLVSLLYGQEDDGELLADEKLPCRPSDDVFEPRLKAVLRRYVVERCIYGVDIDPLAVELCRLALWVETMDRDLPFSFLDHKIKCGNSLVGAWFDQFQHYPVMAWKNREGGDKNHNNGVHFKKGERTKAMRVFRNEVLKEDLVGNLAHNAWTGTPADRVQDQARNILAELHGLPVHDTAERARVYREKFIGSAEWQLFKASLDRWCACWFWPADKLDQAPLPSTFATPSKQTEVITQQLVNSIRFFHWEVEFPDVFTLNRGGFDAILGNPPWEIAKPISKEFFSNIDPLYRSYGKQDALSKQTEYFKDLSIEENWLDYSSGFRAQSNFFKYAAVPYGDPDSTEKSEDRFSLASGRQNTILHQQWRRARVGDTCFADQAHPFRHQGSADIDLYKLFLEQAYALLRRSGRLGFIVPSSLYAATGTDALRKLFLDECCWEWIFGFENREKIFDTDSRSKFNPVIIEKGGTTAEINTSFMHRQIEDWEKGEIFAISYSRKQIEKFSPLSLSILEIQSPREIEILEAIYSNAVLLGDDGPGGWGITYATEFHMTNDSKLFPPKPKWETLGYRPDEYSRWLKGDWRPIEELWAQLGVKLLSERESCSGPYNRLLIRRADIPEGIIISRDSTAFIQENSISVDSFSDASAKPIKLTIENQDGEKNIVQAEGPAIALPLYEGRMVGQFDFSKKGWVSGKGRAAVWRDLSWDQKELEPQFLLATDIYNNKRPCAAHTKVVFMDVTGTTNERSVIAASCSGIPCGHKAPTLTPAHLSINRVFAITGFLNSFVFDFLVRKRLGGNSLTWSVLKETTIPINARFEMIMARLVMQLSLSSPIFAVQIIRAMESITKTKKPYAAVTPHERIRLRSKVDAVTAAAYSLTIADVSSIFADCDWPIDVVGSHLEAKGFWRVDKEKDPELRHTVLSLVAFHDLQNKIEACAGDRERGVEAFCNQNDGQGWMLPETLRLADYGLGHDERAKEHQPVANRLGPRFYDWQLEQDPEDSWRECHLHARNLLGEEGYKQLLEEIEAEKRGERIEPPQQYEPESDDDPKSQPRLI